MYTNLAPCIELSDVIFTKSYIINSYTHFCIYASIQFSLYATTNIKVCILNLKRKRLVPQIFSSLGTHIEQKSRRYLLIDSCIYTCIQRSIYKHARIDKCHYKWTIRYACLPSFISCKPPDLIYFQRTIQGKITRHIERSITGHTNISTFFWGYNQSSTEGHFW